MLGMNGIGCYAARNAVSLTVSLPVIFVAPPGKQNQSHSVSIEFTAAAKSTPLLSRIYLPVGSIGSCTYDIEGSRTE